jgi:hypothetical protein
MLAVGLARCFDQRAKAQDRRFVKPLPHELHVDRELLRAESERHGEGRIAGQVERHRGTHDVGRRHLFP